MGELITDLIPWVLPVILLLSFLVNVSDRMDRPKKKHSDKEEGGESKSEAPLPPPSSGVDENQDLGK